MIVVIVWAIGFVASVLPFALAFVEMDRREFGRVSNDTYAIGAICGFGAALIWPLSLFLIGLFGAVRRAAEASTEADE